MSLFGGPKKMALCPCCSAPLIPTHDFPKFEFYCLECGRHCGFLSPRPGDLTPELDTRYKALKAEWDEHVGDRLRGHGGWYDWCEKCKPGGEPHAAHATKEEWAKHEAALEWLNQRRKEQTCN